MAEWEETGQYVQDRRVVRLKEVGQSIVGKYKEKVEIPDGKFGPETHYIFVGKNAETGQAEEFAVNPNYDLKKRFAVLKVGGLYRMTAVGTKDVGQASPMLLHRLEMAKTGTPAATKPPADDLPF